MAAVQASDKMQFKLINQATGKPNELYMLNLGQAANTVLLSVEPVEASFPELYISTDGNPNKGNYTLALVFHQHMLEEGSLDQVVLGGEQAKDWKLTAVREGTETALYFLYAGVETLNACNLILYQLAVATNFSAASNMELRYRLKGGAINQCQQVALNVLNHQGIAKSPFKLWLDTPKLSTKKDKAQVLKFRLLNNSGQKLDIPNMRLQMVFDVYEDGFKSPEALVIKKVFRERFRNGEAVQVKSLGKVEVRVVKYQGIIDFNKASKKLEKTTLSQGECLNINLVNFHPFPHPGTSTISLRYFNINGYWDGELEVTVQRTAYMEVPNSDVAIELSKDRYLITNKLALEDNLWVRKNVGEKQTSVVISSNGDVRASGSVLGKQIKVKLPLEVKGDQFADLVPPGTIVMWSGTTPPAGWVLCDGKGTVNSKLVPNLSGRFVLGAGYKSICDKNGDSKDHIYPIGNNKDNDNGSERVKLAVNEMPNHNHNVSGKTQGDGAHQHQGFETVVVSTISSGTTVWKQSFANKNPGWMTQQGKGETHKHQININSKNTGEGKWHDNMPPYYVLAYIIKL